MKPVEWLGDRVRILDQTLLPARERFVDARTPEEVADAIRRLAIRGAPLLGIAGAEGTALAAVRSGAGEATALLDELERAGRLIAATRPTAANLGWAVERVVRAGRAAASVDGGRGAKAVDAVREATIAEALRIVREEEASCLAIGRVGYGLVPDRANVLTHCNTGTLATGGEGTAQAVITAAHGAGKDVHVWVDESRPLLQGARLTAWELDRRGVPMTLIADSAAGSLMAGGNVDLVLVGADRIAANGDVANKVGTYQLAVLADHHRIPFYVAAPVSTIDPSTPTGADIVIEERDPSEVTRPLGVPIAPEGVPAANPAFDVTPARLVTAIVTDRGLIEPPYPSAIGDLVRRTGGEVRV